METLLTHRDASGGLFIGASKLLLALMNSAPAELLHLLVHAALQPISGQAWCSNAAALAKKNAGCYAGAGILFQKNQNFFRRIRCLARRSRAQRCKQMRAIRSSTVH